MHVLPSTLAQTNMEAHKGRAKILQRGLGLGFHVRSEKGRVSAPKSTIKVQGAFPTTRLEHTPAQEGWGSGCSLEICPRSFSVEDRCKGFWTTLAVRRFEWHNTGKHYKVTTMPNR